MSGSGVGNVFLKKEHPGGPRKAGSKRLLDWAGKEDIKEREKEAGPEGRGRWGFDGVPRSEQDRPGMLPNGGGTSVGTYNRAVSSSHGTATHPQQHHFEEKMNCVTGTLQLKGRNTSELLGRTFDKPQAVREL